MALRNTFERGTMNQPQRKTTQTKQTANDQFCTLLDWGTVWRNKKLLFLSVMVTCTLGMIYLALERPIYEAEARVLVQNNTTSQGGRNTRVERQFWETQAEIIRSPLTLQRALKSVPITPADGSDPLEYVLKSLKVSTLADTSVVKIGFRDTQEYRATQLIDAVIESYGHYLNQSEHKTHQETINLLTHREKELLVELKKLQDEYRELHAINPVVGQGKEAMVVQLADLKRLGDTITGTRKQRLELENKLQFVNTSEPKTPTVSDEDINAVALIDPVPAETVLPDLQHGRKNRMNPGVGDLDAIYRELREAQARELMLSQKFGPKHPEMKAVRNKIQLLNEQLQESRHSATALAAQELEAVKMTEATLNEMYKNELKKVKEMDGYLLEEQQMLDRIAKVEESHQAALAARSDAQLADQTLASGQSAIAVEVLESPKLSEGLVWPKPAPFMMVCLIVGFLGGCVLIMLHENKGRFFNLQEKSSNA